MVHTGGRGGRGRGGGVGETPEVDVDVGEESSQTVLPFFHIEAVYRTAVFCREREKYISSGISENIRSAALLL